MDITVSLICEGELDCPNRIILTKLEVKQIRDDNKNILCPTCKPKYGHLTQKENMDLGWNSIDDVE